MTFRDPTVDAFISSLIQSIEGKEAQKKSADLVFLPDDSPEELALRELIEIANADTDTGWERTPFDKQRERTREIGERLNALGGFELMSWAHGQFPRIDGNCLERVWHGIGKWKS